MNPQEEKQLITEERSCKDCLNYAKDNRGDFCKKKLMGVVPDMKVTFYKNKGTCFEEKNNEEKDLLSYLEGEITYNEEHQSVWLTKGNNSVCICHISEGVL